MQPWWGNKCREPGDWGVWCLNMTKSEQIHFCCSWCWFEVSEEWECFICMVDWRWGGWRDLWWLTLCRADCPHTILSALTSSSSTGKSTFGQLPSVRNRCICKQGAIVMFVGNMCCRYLNSGVQHGGDGSQNLMWCSDRGPPLTWMMHVSCLEALVPACNTWIMWCAEQRLRLVVSDLCKYGFQAQLQAWCLKVGNLRLPDKDHKWQRP